VTRHDRRRVLVVAFATAAAACARAARGAQPAAAGRHTVVIEGMAFSPATLHVRRGDRITWVNKDLVPHTATAKDRSFDSGRIAAGASWSRVASRRGTLEYDCTYHPTMTATLVVE